MNHRPVSLIYLDQSCLTYFSKARSLAEEFTKKGFSFAYSAATMMDLKSARHRDLEFRFLIDSNAYFLEEVDGQLTGIQRDANDVFQSQERSVPIALGAILNRAVGGGPNISQREFLSALIARLSGVDPFPIDDDVQFTEIFERSDLRKSFEKITKIAPDQTLSQFIEGHDEVAKTALVGIFPAQPPKSVEGRVICAILLNFILGRPAKGIRGEKPDASEREVIDCYHISYGLGCDCFLTQDKATHQKYKILSEYWRTKGTSYCMSIEKVQDE